MSTAKNNGAAIERHLLEETSHIDLIWYFFATTITEYFQIVTFTDTWGQAFYSTLIPWSVYRILSVLWSIS